MNVPHPLRSARSRLLVAFVAALAATPAGAMAGTFALEGFASIGGPVRPEFFSAGWGGGYGIGGGLGLSTSRTDIMLQGEFAQFSFQGYEGLGNLGGERRFSTLALLLRYRVWERVSAKHEGLAVAASAGWGHQSIAGTFGEGQGAQALLGDGTEDGLVWTAGLEFARDLYRTTRWAVGLRYSQFHFENETPAHVTLCFALRMPLAGSRPGS